MYDLQCALHCLEQLLDQKSMKHMTLEFGCSARSVIEKCPLKINAWVGILTCDPLYGIHRSLLLFICWCIWLALPSKPLVLLPHIQILVH